MGSTLLLAGIGPREGLSLLCALRGVEGLNLQAPAVQAALSLHHPEFTGWVCGEHEIDEAE